MPAIITGPYDNAEYVLNLTRSIVNDASLSIAGNVFSDSQPYTFPLLNAAYRDLQDALTDGGVETFFKTLQLFLITPVTPLDPAVTIYIDYNGFFNGSVYAPNPVIPSDLVIPLRLWERQSYTTNYYAPMFPVNDGLPNVAQTPCLRYWDWQSDKLVMPGATQTNDLQIRYFTYLPELTDGTSPVLILRSAQALAYFTAYQFGNSRGSALAPNLYEKAMGQVDKMINRTTKRSNRGNHRRIPFGRQSRASGWGTW